MLKTRKNYFLINFSIGSIINNNIEQETDFLDQPVQFFYFKNEFFINHQKILFENLWNNSIPAREKLTEIKKGAMDLILNPHGAVDVNMDVDETSKQILFRILESTVDQILILIPSTDLFWYIYHNGLLKLISKTILRDVTVKILIHLNENQTSIKKDLGDRLRGFAQTLQINTNFFSKQIPQEHISIIVDNAVLIEIGNNDSDNNNDNNNGKDKVN